MLEWQCPYNQEKAFIESLLQKCLNLMLMGLPSIRGTLFDNKGLVVLDFSRPIRIKDSDELEILAIKEAHKFYVPFLFSQTSESVS